MFLLYAFFRMPANLLRGEAGGSLAKVDEIDAVLYDGRNRVALLSDEEDAEPTSERLASAIHEEGKIWLLCAVMPHLCQENGYNVPHSALSGGSKLRASAYFYVGSAS